MEGGETADNEMRKSIFWIAQHSDEDFAQTQQQVHISIRGQVGPLTQPGKSDSSGGVIVDIEKKKRMAVNCCSWI